MMPPWVLASRGNNTQNSNTRTKKKEALLQEEEGGEMPKATDSTAPHSKNKVPMKAYIKVHILAITGDC